MGSGGIRDIDSVTLYKELMTITNSDNPLEYKPYFNPWNMTECPRVILPDHM